MAGFIFTSSKSNTITLPDALSSPKFAPLISLWRILNFFNMCQQYTLRRLPLCFGPATGVIGQAVVEKLQRNSLSHAALRLHDSQHSRNTNTLYIYCYYYLNINMIFIYLSYCTVYRVGGRTSRKGHKWQVPVCVNLTRTLTEASGSQLINTAQKKNYTGLPVRIPIYTCTHSPCTSCNSLYVASSAWRASWFPILSKSTNFTAQYCFSV